MSVRVGGRQGSAQRWRRWWPLLARSLIAAVRAVEVQPLRAARLPQLFPRRSEQTLPNPARETEPGMVCRAAEELQVLRLQPHVEGGGVLAGAALRLAHAARVADPYRESQHRVLTSRI